MLLKSQCFKSFGNQVYVSLVSLSLSLISRLLRCDQSAVSCTDVCVSRLTTVITSDYDDDR